MWGRFKSFLNERWEIRNSRAVCFKSCVFCACSVRFPESLPASNTAMIVGIVCAALFLLVLIAAVACIVMRVMHNRHDYEGSVHHSRTYMTSPSKAVNSELDTAQETDKTSLFICKIRTFFLVKVTTTLILKIAIIQSYTAASFKSWEFSGWSEVIDAAAIYQLVPLWILFVFWLWCNFRCYMVEFFSNPIVTLTLLWAICWFVLMAMWT